MNGIKYKSGENTHAEQPIRVGVFTILLIMYGLLCISPNPKPKQSKRLWTRRPEVKMSRDNKLPWETWSLGDIIVKDPKTCAVYVICSFDKSKFTLEEKDQHRKLIVRTVNAQPEIVAFLEKYIERNTDKESGWCYECNFTLGDSRKPHNLHCNVAQAESLLKTLGGE